MKKNENKRMSLKKLTIAKLGANAMKHLKGGDCLPTEHLDWESDVYCDNSHIP